MKVTFKFKDKSIDTEIPEGYKYIAFDKGGQLIAYKELPLWSEVNVRYQFDKPLPEYVTPEYFLERPTNQEIKDSLRELDYTAGLSIVDLNKNGFGNE